MVDKSNKTSVPDADDTSGPSEVTVLPATEPLTEPPSSVTTQQVLAEDLTVLPVASSAPSCSSKPSSTSPDVGQTREMINSLFPGGAIVHSFYHCTESKCHYQKEKGRKKFDHAWIFRRDLCYDSTTGLWWLLFVQEKGMFCLLCRLHQAKSKHNKSVSYGMEPAVRFQTSALNEHCSGQKHQDSIAAEMLRRTSIFQEKLDERNLHQHAILHSAFMSLYWQVQHGIAYRNFPSMLKLMRSIGLEKLEHFRHESLWSVRGILTTMGRVIKGKITKAASETRCYGLMVDDVTDIQVKEQNIIFIQYVQNTQVQIRFLAINDLMEGDAVSPNAETITRTIKEEMTQSGLDSQKFLSLASDGASVMVGKNRGVSALLKRDNPRLINVHCICHRLALACGDSNNDIEYVLTIERLLVQLYRWLENSCVKTAAYMKMQLRLQSMQLPAEESKRHKIGHKLQRACRTRWLSTDKAVQGVWQDYVAILQTLSADEFKNDATAIGLLSQLKTVKFIGKRAVLLLTFNIVFVQSYCVFTCLFLISHLLYRGYLRPQVYSSRPGNS